MLLNELIGVKKYYSSTANQILMMFDDNSIKVNSGRFGLTLSHSSWKHVIKAFPQDDCYMSFLDYVAKNQSNPHLPKIILKPKKMTAFFKRNVGNDTFYVAKIEKLSSMTGSEVNKLSKLNSNGFIKQATKAQEDGTFDSFIESKDLGNFKKLIETAIEVVNDNETDCFNDLHSGNIMKRSDGTLVITDPLGGYTKSEAEDRYLQINKFSKELYSILSASGIWGDVVDGPKRATKDASKSVYNSLK